MLTELLDGLYPENYSCLLCGAECVPDAMGLCSVCADELIWAAQPPVPKYLDGIFSGLAYRDKVKSAMLRYKYEECRYLSRFFARFMEIDPAWGAEALIPVPLHISRERERGYNQSHLLAEDLSAACGLPVDGSCLVRIRKTSTQTGYSAASRRRNVSRAFVCAERPPYGTVVLVDDVCTTGSTLSQCAAELKKAGVNRVYAVTACHA